ncbi:endonuclease [Georgenia subflava]|uniref:Endonuclease n=1 Tax=Georgenia subflava TaxID=1622177 RepID=A0A6N7EFQ9_9MICO|nr:endonuclease [Georgenia subflava]
MRLLTLNLQHCLPARGSGDAGRAPDAARVAALAQEVGALAPDVVLLQEVDRRQARSGGVDQAAVLAETMGMRYRFAASVAGSVTGVRLPVRRSDTARGYGVALLTRLPVTTWHVRHLRGSGLRRRPSAPWHSVRGWTWDPTRVLLAAVLRTETGPLTVAVTHLSTAPDVARRQLVRSVTSVGALPGPHVLGGDLNLDPAAVATTVDLDLLAHAPTFTNARPRTQLDHLLGSAGVVPAGPGTAHHLSVSDHAGLSVDVRLVGLEKGARMSAGQ